VTAVEQNRGSLPKWFATTRWSVVLAAGSGPSEPAQQALAALCQTYWYPLYTFVRTQGYSSHDAEDLTQAFFVRMLEKRAFDRADPQIGKFRYFLLASLRNFLADEYARTTAMKRGGGRRSVSFDAQTAEERFQLEPIDASSPEKLYERRWSLTLLEKALSRLKAEYIVARKDRLYDELEAFLKEPETAPGYAEVAFRLALTEAALKSALFRFRQRYRELVREEIAQTVATAAEIEEEIRHLIRVMSA
jgi:RNA polymerase sigma-70 factor (ECF subfamily)